LIGPTQDPASPVRIVRIIARLNIGGPAIQAITLTRRLEEYGYATVLVRGREEPDEGTMDHLAQELDVRPVLVPWMRRNPGWRDIPALISVIRIIRRERPEIVHTHAAKGGTLGRGAALLASLGRPRPILVHTYHGHSLTGYFTPRVASVYRRIERSLGRYCDRLIAVSDEVRDELVEMGVASASRFEVVPLGFDLSAFASDSAAKRSAGLRFRTEFAIPEDARVLTLVARLAPIKRVDRFLRVARALSDLPDLRFLIVGDGGLRASLQASPEALSLRDRLTWAGFRRDMTAVYAASDVVMQTSDNEGTPVSLIEAQATGVPVVSTRVGGTETVVGDGRCLADPADEDSLAAAARFLLTNQGIAEEVARAGQKQVLARFTLDRLVSDVDGLYRTLRPRATGRGRRG
jgi:glycosyltransferase involved in cell wall biosynthesis